MTQKKQTDPDMNATKAPPLKYKSLCPKDTAEALQWSDTQ